MVGIKLDALQINRRTATVLGELPIEGLDPSQQLVRVIASRSMRREANAIRQEDNMLCHTLGGVEILLNERRRHALSTTGVRESFASSSVDGKLTRRVERVDTC